MALNADAVRVGVTGAVMTAPTTTTAPTGTGGTTTGFVDLGYVNEDGVTITFPDGGDTTPIKAWQNGATIRTIRAASEDSPEVTFTLLETSIPVIEAALGVTVTDTATEGSFEFDSTDLLTAQSWVVDVVDGAELLRVYVPKGTPTGGLELVFKNDEPIGYAVTLDCERDNAAGYNLKVWSTGLKTAV